MYSSFYGKKFKLMDSKVNEPVTFKPGRRDGLIESRKWPMCLLREKELLGLVSIITPPLYGRSSGGHARAPVLVHDAETPPKVH